MPTAVERLLDSFLNFDTSREQLKLDNAFLKSTRRFRNCRKWWRLLETG